MQCRLSFYVSIVDFRAECGIEIYPLLISARTLLTVLSEAYSFFQEIMGDPVSESPSHGSDMTPSHHTKI